MQWQNTQHTCSSSKWYFVAVHVRAAVFQSIDNKRLKVQLDPENTVRDISKFCAREREVTELSKLSKTTFMSSKSLQLFFQPLYILENSIHDASFCQQHFASHSFSCTLFAPVPFMTSFLLATGMKPICQWHWWKFAGRSARNPALQAHTGRQWKNRYYYS